MSDELARLRERIRQNREDRGKLFPFPGPLAPTTASRTNAPIREGTKVFDTVTGLEGEVIGGASETIIVPAAKR